MPENIEQNKNLAATVKTCFALIFNIYVGNTSKTIAVQFVFQQLAFIERKSGKYIFAVGDLKTIKITGEIGSYHTSSSLPKRSKTENICHKILI